jgi:hypothetical protein
MMLISKVRAAVLSAVLTASVGLAGAAWASQKLPAARPNAPVAPPKPSPVVLTLNYAGGMILRPATPYLQIHANGLVVLTNPNGQQKQSRLTAAQLQQLLRFVNQQNFANITSAQIEADIQKQQQNVLITDAATTIITLSTDNKSHTVSVYAADTYLAMYPKIKPLAEFVAIEQRLQTLANR